MLFKCIRIAKACLRQLNLSNTKKGMNISIIWDIICNLPYLMWIPCIMKLKAFHSWVPNIWNTLPDRLKKIESVKAFKMVINNWKPKKCPSRLIYPQDIYSQCLFYLRKPPELLQKTKWLNSNNFCFIFFSKKWCKYLDYYNYMYNCEA